MVVHLYQREGDASAAEDHVQGALQQYLAWSPAKARGMLVRSLRIGLVLQSGEQLRLSPRGRETAQSVIEPWQKR